MRLRPAPVRGRRVGRRGPRRGGPAGRPDRREPGVRRRMLVVDRRRARRRGPGLPAARPAARRPAGRAPRDGGGAPRGPRRRAHRLLRLRGRARPPVRVLPRDVRGARGAAREQGRVEAARPPRRRRGFRPDRRAGAAGRRHVGGLRGREGEAGGVTAMSDLVITYVGGPTAILEVAGLRLLTDPTFDPPGQRYNFGWGTSSRKLQGPAIAAADLGPIDAVLLSHDHHDDNLDAAGRALLPSLGRVITTPSGAKRLGGESTGLAPWTSTTLQAGD